MRFLYVGSIFTILLVVLLSFQNCSKVDFTKIEPTTAAKVSLNSSAEIISCRDMLAPELQPQLKSSWDFTQDLEPTANQILAAPVVGDIDGDGIAEVAFVSFKGPDVSGVNGGVLRVLSGRNFEPRFSINAENLRPSSTMSPLIVDIDGDGFGEVIYLHYKGTKIIAINYDGQVRWELPLDFSGSSLAALSGCNGGFSAADLDKDGRAEIIADGWIIKEGNDGQPFIKARSEILGQGCFTFGAHLSKDSKVPMRIIGKVGVMDQSGKFLYRFKQVGFPAVADIAPEVPGNEIVVSGGGHLAVYNGNDGSELLNQDLSVRNSYVCENGSVGGGQATIADFDGDPATLEIAVATGKALSIFNGKGEKIAISEITNCTSATAGLSAFDFNGDGKSELVFSDEQYLRIYEMDTAFSLRVIWERFNPSLTLNEYPVVADIDGDGESEIIAVSNTIKSEDASSVDGSEAGLSLTYGIRSFSSEEPKSWMPASNIWNQHSFLGSNIQADLKVASNTIIEGKLNQFFKRSLALGLKEQRCRAR